MYNCAVFRTSALKAVESLDKRVTSRDSFRHGNVFFFGLLMSSGPKAKARTKVVRSLMFAIIPCETSMSSVGLAALGQSPSKNGDSESFR